MVPLHRVVCDPGATQMTGRHGITSSTRADRGTGAWQAAGRGRGPVRFATRPPPTHLGVHVSAPDHPDPERSNRGKRGRAVVAGTFLAGLAIVLSVLLLVPRCGAAVQDSNGSADRAQVVVEAVVSERQPAAPAAQR